MAFALAGWSHGRSVGFLTFLNDFWGNAFAAEHWQWSAGRLWNGFFPPGYPFLLTILPGKRLIESAYGFNLLSGLGVLGAVGLFMARSTSAWLGVAAAGLVALHPVVVTQVLTTGADAPFIALTTVGTLGFFRALDRPARGVVPVLAAGAALGLAGWIRYHGFAWAAALVVGAALAGAHRTPRVVLLVLAPVAAAGLALVALGLAAGDIWAIQRDQAFNTYVHLVQAPDWFHLPPRASLPATVPEAIARDPQAFWQNYLRFIAPHGWLLAAPLAAALLGSGPARRFGVFVLGASLVFIPVVGLGASPRGVACVVPPMLCAAVWMMSDATRRVPPASRTAVAVLAMVLVTAFGWTYWRPAIRAYVDEARVRAAISQDLEARLRADRVTIGMQVFSTTELYFLRASGWQVANYHPRVVGGWPTFDLPGYNETYPPPSSASLDAFIDDCHRFGITHLALGAASTYVLPELGEVFDGRRRSARLAELPGIAGVRLFRLIG